MNPQSRVNVRWTVLLLAGVLLVGAGAGAAYLGLRSKMAAPAPSETAMRMPGPALGSGAAAAAAVPASGPLADVTVTLAKEAIERAGITVSTVSTSLTSDGVRAPGVVEPNAYKQVVVTPLVAGRLTRVAAELGQRVTRGQTIAQIFSPELAEAQTRYVTARAELDAHEQELARTEKLVALGAASKQELERIEAEHTSRRAALQSVASRLRLLGLSAEAIEGLGPGKAVEATTSVPAPIDGIVTERDANVGANVDLSAKLFTIVDLSTVWVVADLFEKDFARVRTGSVATITTRAYPDLALRGRVSYIDPQVSADTRTAKVRIEVPNARHQLRFGMYAEATFHTDGGASTPMVPRTALQNIGDRTVVYLADPKQPGRFIEREVRIGTATGDRVPVLTGLRSGDLVVTEGSFYVRAELERLGLRPAAAFPSAATASSGTPAATHAGLAQDARVQVTDSGFEPARLVLKAGAPARITFTRTSDKTCGTAVVFPSLDIRRDLPLNTPVVIEFTPPRSGEIAFACGMNMFNGSVVVK
jgi:RND family efflux transporter MFP subunit